MVREIAVLKVIFHSCGIAAVPGITAHDRAFKTSVSCSAHQKRNYIKEAGWNGQLCDYISSVKWLEDDPEHSFEVKVTFPKDRLMDEQGRTEKQPFTFSTWVAFCATGRDGDSIQLDNEDGSKDKGLRRRLVNQAWTLASRMGWELWQPIDIEIPMANVTLHQAPKDEQAARELQAMLEKAKANGEHLRQKINVTESIEFHDKAGEA